MVKCMDCFETWPKHAPLCPKAPSKADQQKAAKVPLWQGFIAYFSNAMHAVGTISKFGAAKHNDGKMPTKWRDYPVEVYADALARHITEEGKGHLYDSESHMLHAGHEAWNALARLEKLLEVHPLVEPVPDELVNQEERRVLDRRTTNCPGCYPRFSLGHCESHPPRRLLSLDRRAPHKRIA